MSYEASRTEFWRIVQACLEDIFEMSPASAAKEISRLNRGQAGAHSGKNDLMYHSQPIHVASNIALGDKPASDEMLKSYDRILKRFEDVRGLPKRKDGLRTMSDQKLSEQEAFTASG